MYLTKFYWMAGVPEVTLLEGRSNYASWKFQMQHFLTDCGLWNCVLGTETDVSLVPRALAKIGLC